jgi:hypothetical protein
MKVHVPANFVGYGTFAMAAMLAFAYLIKQSAGEPAGGSWRRCGCWAWCCASSRWCSAAARRSRQAGYWFIYFGVSALIVGGILGRAAALPSACPRWRCWTT